MSEENQKTLEAYEKGAQAYRDDTPKETTGPYEEWFRRAVEGMPAGAKIFEIGSATGRDAKFFESLGYKVQRSDAAESFIQELRGEGYDALKFNLITDEVPMGYDMIFANGVLMHLIREEEEEAFRKIYAALSENGRFVFSVKTGDDGGAWSDHKVEGSRYYYMWKEDELRGVLAEVGFANIDIGTLWGKWLHVIVNKESLR